MSSAIPLTTEISLRRCCRLSDGARSRDWLGNILNSNRVVKDYRAHERERFSQ